MIASTIQYVVKIFLVFPSMPRCSAFRERGLFIIFLGETKMISQKQQFMLIFIMVHLKNRNEPAKYRMVIILSLSNVIFRKGLNST